uniref:baculoviral IAP repeat-containing protein 2-like isoform X2 n=1 Tax=Ciona intestinalis TaxID=7719 RepID=UPI000EF52FA1|nr:baculoviral IAP repeat-containing protein 2-like isoform X2 [Ciona intestinalis]|eukprot:XP_026695044.1 baculoviral IAP repeat-containing protein 2-like isoform X2 [Ciona intestinalis]
MLADIETDGMRVNHTRDPPGQKCVYIIPGDKEKEVYRLTTYRQFPMHVPVNVMLLATLGFLYTGFKDRIKCFRCGQCVEGLNGTEDMSLPGWHKPDCEFANGTDTTNVPLRRLTEGPSHRSISPPSNMETNISAGELLNSATVNTSQQVETPNNLSVHQTPAAGPLNQTATVHRPSPPTPSAIVQSTRATEPGNSFPGTSLFPCNDPLNPHMRSESARLQTYLDNIRNWPSQQVLATPQQLSKAGLFYLGERDRVKCWYCNGGLQNWNRDDDAWFEHAKWFPECEFVLQQKGPEYVHNIVSMFPTLRRPAMPRQNRSLPQVTQSYANTPAPINGAPEIIDPREELRKLKALVDEEMTSSEIVPEVIMMGFEVTQIRNAIQRNQEINKTRFTSATDLVDAIINSDPNTELPDLEEEEPAPLDVPSTSAAAPEDTSSELRRLEKSKICRVCKKEEAAVVLLPCGHLSCCVTCSNNVKKCPVCKFSVKDTVRSYIV